MQFNIKYYYLTALLIFLASSCTSIGQISTTDSTQTIQLDIIPTYGLQQIDFSNTKYPLPEGDSLEITMLRYYISHIQLLSNDSIAWAEPQSYHLIDSLGKIRLQTPKNLHYTTIRFYLGIDSLTNDAGAMGGDLDPTKGMYWAWQSGYINFKLEGTSKRCSTRKNAFQYHIGGYLHPYNALQTITIPLKTHNTNKIHLQIDIQKLLSQIDLAQRPTIMTPSEDALQIAKTIAKCFITSN